MGINQPVRGTGMVGGMQAEYKPVRLNAAAGGGGETFFLLKEDGDRLLLETGDRMLKEDAP